METALRSFGNLLLDNTGRSITITLIIIAIITHLASSAYRSRSSIFNTKSIFGSNMIDIIRAGFSVLLFITGLRIFGTVLTVETCGRLSEDDFIVFGTVGMVTCIVIGGVEIKTALLGKKIEPVVAASLKGPAEPA